MKTYLKQALFILAVVGIAKYVNGAMPANPLDKFLPA
jgi:hypothetical protein